MNRTFRNIFAAITGLIVGSLVNGAIISVSATLIPPPEGAVLTTYEGLKASMSLMEPKHFLMPFLAHALGTLVGALVAALIAVDKKMQLAIGIGVLFMIGGIINIVMLPSPIWFTVVDVVFAYIPMAYLGGKLALRRNA